MSAERRQRPFAATARIDSQPYRVPDQRTQTIKEWVASLGDAPQPQLGRLASNTAEAPPPPTATPPPLPSLPLPVEAQYPAIPALAVDSGWGELGTNVTDYRVQAALASALELPLLPPADYSNLAPDVRMKEPWERSTVASTMHTVSMLDWNADADAGSEFEVMSDWTARPSGPSGRLGPPRDIGKVLKVPAVPHQEKKGKEREEGSDYAPSSRSVTPPPKAQPRPVRTPRNTATTTRRAANLDEDYDEQDIDLDSAISGEPKAKKRRYISSGTTAVEDHSARSSPRESQSPSPPPPPPTRRRGVLRGKVAWRASFRTTTHFSSREASGSESA